LSALNLRLVGHLAAIGPQPLVRVLGPAGEILHQRARGIDPRPVRPRPEEDEIRKEAALAEDTNDPAALRRTVRALAGEVARDLRARRRTASRLRLELRHADARGASAGTRLAAPTDLDPLLARAAEGLLDRALSRRIRVRSLVLRAAGLGQGRIASLFDEPAVEEARAAALAAALDRIRARFGDGAIRMAAA